MQRKLKLLRSAVLLGIFSAVLSVLVYAFLVWIGGNSVEMYRNLPGVALGVFLFGAIYRFLLHRYYFDDDEI